MDKKIELPNLEKLTELVGEEKAKLTVNTFKKISDTIIECESLLDTTQKELQTTFWITIMDNIIDRNPDIMNFMMRQSLEELRRIELEKQLAKIPTGVPN
jgi:hypothetical protein